MLHVGAERPLECIQLGPGKFHGWPRLRRDSIKSVEGAGHDEELGWHTREREPAGVFNLLADEEIDTAGSSPVFPARRRSLPLAPNSWNATRTGLTVSMFFVSP